MFEMEKKLKWSKLKVGSVITLALLLLCLAVFFAGNLELLVSPKINFKVQFRDVKGLRKGAPVWIFGTEVGSVKDIELDPIYGTIVDISVNKNVHGFIKKDSTASILTMGLLGDKFVELGAGSPFADPIGPGEMIKGTTQIEFSDVMETSAATIQKMTEFIQKLQDFLTKIEKGQGTLAKFIEDPTVYDNINKTTQSLLAIANEIKSSQGTLKMLIEDPSLYNRLMTATTSIEAFTRKLNESSGSLNKFVEDPTLYNRLLAASSLLEDFFRKVKDGQGTLTKLIEDPELYNNLNKTSKHLASISERVEKGEGVAGALVRDDELAVQVKDTIVKYKELAAEIEKLAAEMKELTKDIKEHPRKYLKFSIF